MKHFRRCATWGLAIVAILLSPVILIFAIVAGIGIGLDVFDAFGEWPFVVIACAPFVFVLLRQAWPHALAHRAVVAALAHVHRPVGYAPKSMS